MPGLTNIRGLKKIDLSKKARKGAVKKATAKVKKLKAYQKAHLSKPTSHPYSQYSVGVDLEIRAAKKNRAAIKRRNANK